MTTTIMRSWLFSRDRLLSDLSDFFNDGETTDEEIANTASVIISKVNDALPGSLWWDADTSEIHADTTDETEFSADSFTEILNTITAEVLY